MSRQRKNERQAEVEKVRSEGLAAARAGLPAEANPYLYMDSYQWARGWLEGSKRKLPAGSLYAEACRLAGRRIAGERR